MSQMDGRMKFRSIRYVKTGQGAEVFSMPRLSARRWLELCGAHLNPGGRIGRGGVEGLRPEQRLGQAVQLFAVL